ncbi:hypothetical protein FB451DRAFT_1248713 [Mycena latifolia]|nr:hypothetical protein FB451DRAFT_1248713 [Mycena latifolia]
MLLIAVATHRLFWVGFPAYSVGCLYIASLSRCSGTGNTSHLSSWPADTLHFTAAFAIFSTVIAVIQLTRHLHPDPFERDSDGVANVCATSMTSSKGAGKNWQSSGPLTDVEANALADLYQAVGALCQGVLDGKLDRTGWLSLWWCWKARAFTTEIVLARPSEFQWERTGNEKACLVD